MRTVENARTYSSSVDSRFSREVSIVFCFPWKGLVIRVLLVFLSCGGTTREKGHLIPLVCDILHLPAMSKSRLHGVWEEKVPAPLLVDVMHALSSPPGFSSIQISASRSRLFILRMEPFIEDKGASELHAESAHIFFQGSTG